MNYIRDEILEVAQAVGADVVQLPFAEAERIRSQLLAKFTSGNTSGYMWENLQNDVSLQDPDGWRWIADYADSEPVVILFNSYQDPSMLLFATASQVAPVISECTGFEFYITDEDTNYLLAFNHHDFVIAVGAAVPWLQHRASSTHAPGDG